MIGLSVALAARRAQFPDEFDRLALISEGLIKTQGHVNFGIHVGAVTWKDSWEVEVANLTARFGLVMAPRRGVPLLGYVRLPSSQDVKGMRGKRRRLYMARFTVDQAAVASW